MKIALLGDIALFGKNAVSNPNWRDTFAPIKQILDKYDYVVGNLESPLTRSYKTIGGKSAYLKGNPENVEMLKYLGVTHVSLANNHMFDYRKQGLEDSIRLLEDNEIEWYGINGKKATINAGKNHITLLGYCCYSTNAKGMGIVNILNPKELENDIDILRNTLPIISIHWGQEHVHYPNYDHVLMARKLCKNRKMVIHGHHPHVIQGIKEEGESIIAYSLGNFCFDDVYTKKSKYPLIKLSKDNMESFILELEVEDNNIVAYKAIPFAFQDSEYVMQDELIEKIHEWSEFLNENEKVYKEKREKDLQAYLAERKAKRNLEWYLRRMNLESVKMILSARKNSKLYASIVLSYIRE